jgi:hypothetical protein
MATVGARPKGATTEDATSTVKKMFANHEHKQWSFLEIQNTGKTASQKTFAA